MEKRINVYREKPKKCPYLANEDMRVKCFESDEIEQEELDFLLKYNWRHFGPHFFKHDCDYCNSCINVRININKFLISKSQKRLIRKNTDLLAKTFFTRAKPENIELLNSWQENRTEQRKWKKVFWYTDLFEKSFILNDSISRELGLFNPEGKLIAKTFYDITSNSLNMLYSCYDPEYQKRRLGIYLILACLNLVRSSNKKYLYLGHWNHRVLSLQYKKNFSGLECFDEDLNEWIDFKNYNGPKEFEE